MLKIYTTEYCEQGIVVSQRVITLFGLPIYLKRTETSNYNYVGQFDADNFIKTREEEFKAPLYTQTNIGFTNHDEKAEETAIQSEGILRKS